MRAVGRDCAPAPLAVAPSPPAGPEAGAGAPPGPGMAGVPPAKRGGPRLTKLALTPRAFATIGKRGGARLSFTLDLAARVVLSVDRLQRGRRASAGAACFKRAKAGRRCDVARPAGQLVQRAHAGVTRGVFRGVLPRSAQTTRASRLVPRRYRLNARPDGGAAASLTFIVKRGRHRSRPAASTHGERGRA